MVGYVFKEGQSVRIHKELWSSEFDPVALYDDVNSASSIKEQF